MFCFLPLCSNKFISQKFPSPQGGSVKLQTLIRYFWKIFFYHWHQSSQIYIQMSKQNQNYFSHIKTIYTNGCTIFIKINKKIHHFHYENYTASLKMIRKPTDSPCSYYIICINFYLYLLVGREISKKRLTCLYYLWAKTVTPKRHYNMTCCKLHSSMITS